MHSKTWKDSKTIEDIGICPQCGALLEQSDNHRMKTCTVCDCRVIYFNKTLSYTFNWKGNIIDTTKAISKWSRN